MKEYISKARAALQGYKTYIAAAGIVLVAVGGFASGDLSAVEAAQQILAAFGIGSLRAGVKRGASQ